MSDTPRTDIVERIGIVPPSTTWVPADFARILERELAEANKRMDAIAVSWQLFSAAMDCSDASEEMTERQSNLYLRLEKSICQPPKQEAGEVKGEN